MKYQSYRDLIKKHEGFSLKVYEDTVGNPSVGWGHAFLYSPKPAVGTVFSDEQVIEFFENDMHIVEKDYVWLENRFALHHLNYVRRGVLKNMLFNLGLTKLLGFRKMIKALQEGKWKQAASELLDSKYAKQVKGRAVELAHLLQTGKMIET